MVSTMLYRALSVKAIEMSTNSFARTQNRLSFKVSHENCSFQLDLEVLFCGLTLIHRPLMKMSPFCLFFLSNELVQMQNKIKNPFKNEKWWLGTNLTVRSFFDLICLKHLNLEP